MKKTLFALLAIWATFSLSAQRLNKAELKSLQQFLSQPAAEASTNAEALKITNLNDPSTWKGIKTDNGRITEIDWSGHKLAGSLNLSGFTSLQKLNIAHNKISRNPAGY